jgi:O-antigen biosynthesis protein
MYPDIVTVIIPTCDRPRLLRRALDSLRAQTCKELEVVVVNDAGTAVPEIATEYTDLNIKYLEHQQRRGLSAARNTGLANSSGRWVCYLDDDDTFTPTHLEKTVAVLRKEMASVVYSDCIRVYERREAGGRITILEEVPEHVAEVNPAAHLVMNIVPVGSVVHDRTCLEKTGTFDETLTVAEDYDLWLRFHVAGFQFYHVPDAATCVHADLNGNQMTAERLEQFPVALRRIFSRYADFAKQFPGVAEGQERFLRFNEWRTRVAKAFLDEAKGKSQITIEMTDILFQRGFMGEIWQMLFEANWGPQAMLLPGEKSAGRGPFGKKWLLRQLLKELKRPPVPLRNKKQDRDK